MLVFPKTAPSQTFPSLTSFLYLVRVCHFVPVSRLCWIWWGARMYAVTDKCLHPEQDEIRTAGQQNCVLDLLYWKAQQMIHIAYKILGFELLEQYILFFWFL